MTDMTDAEWRARRIMARIEEDKCVHLSSIMEELATPRPFCSMDGGVGEGRQHRRIMNSHEVSIHPAHIVIHERESIKKAADRAGITESELRYRLGGPYPPEWIR